MRKKPNWGKKTSPKFTLEAETYIESIENSPWVECPHDYTVRIIDMVRVTDQILSDFMHQVEPTNLSNGERQFLYRRLGLLHNTLLDLGRVTRVEPESVLMS